MSRIGRQPIAVPAGVTISFEGEDIVVKGPLGSLRQYVDKNIKIIVDKNIIHLERASDVEELKAKTRPL